MRFSTGLAGLMLGAGERVKQHVSGTYAVRHRRVLVSPGSIRWVKVRGCKS